MSYDEELRALSVAADNGDFEVGERLLRLFAGLAEDPENAHPELVRHVARCIGDLLKARPIHGAAAKAMRLQKPRKRLPLESIQEKHVVALRAYFVARTEERSFNDALNDGGEAGNISPERVHDLVAKRGRRAPLHVVIKALLGLTKEEKEKLHAILNKQNRDDQ